MGIFVHNNGFNIHVFYIRNLDQAIVLNVS